MLQLRSGTTVAVNISPGSATGARHTLKPRDLSLTVLSVAATVALLYYGRLFFITLFIALSLALILEPLVAALIRLRLPRPLASFLVCTGALFVLYLIGLGIYAQLSSLYRELPTYSSRINELVTIVSQRIEEMERATYRILVPKRDQMREQPSPSSLKVSSRGRPAQPPLPSPPPVQEVRILQERSPVLSYVLSRLGSVYDVLLMASFVPFLVYFMLSWRDHLYRAFLLLFEGHARLVASSSVEGIATMVRSFVVGNFLLGILLAAISSLLFMAFDLPYPLLTGPVSGFLSLIPYAGLPLSLVPAILAALPVYNTLTPYLLLGGAVSLLHLIALNLLYPKIVGARVHLNPLVATVALMIWSVLWGAIGLILAIPLTAAIKAICDNVSGLRPYGRLLGD